MSSTIFDIETSPLDEATILARVKPFKPPEPPGEFCEASVKTGNLKDPVAAYSAWQVAKNNLVYDSCESEKETSRLILEERKQLKQHEDAVAKVNAKVEAARAKHTIEVVAFKESTDILEATWKANAIDKAALSPQTGELLAIGYRVELKDDQTPMQERFSEFEILQGFWMRYAEIRKSGGQMIGHNIIHFDIPFLIGRSWAQGIEIPATVLKGRYIENQTFVDTQQIGETVYGAKLELAYLSQMYGGPGKPEGEDGSMFAETLKTDPQRAKEYLINDLAMTEVVAERMGLV